MVAQSTLIPTSILPSSFITTCSSHSPISSSSFQGIKVTSLIRCDYATPDPLGTQQGGRGGGAGGSTCRIKITPPHGITHDKNKNRQTSFDGYYENVVHQQLTLGGYAQFINTTNGHLPFIHWPHHHHLHEGDSVERIKDRVERIKSMLASMDDGEITVSPYDTAWVALVEDTEGGAESKKPRFPESLEWICNNQLRDGSWGDEHMFQAHDRILNTLACVIALTRWNVHPHQCHRGMEFIRKNGRKLGEEKEEQMPIGFEVAFPSLIEMGRGLGIHLLLDSQLLQHIYAKRSLKLSRIPLEMVHRKPTTLLHSLEGMSGLDWDKLLKLQSKDGSFLFSPSSTAFALINTNNFNCFSYLQKTLQKFNGGVPNVYPVDLFEHIWVVDRLQRLGISRFFETEIKACMDYVYRNWSEKGIGWARNSEVQDIDDTAMGFRLLRLHGYHVSADVFKNFKKDKEFICFAGQSTQAVTGMFNLYRASQVQYPGETILEEARDFSSMYLREKQASNQLLDKWIIQKDLPGEVGYALDLPWYASLPRIETRIYIEQYGGDDDVWIGKTLYRMPYVNNNIYLELAKLDYNTCQAVHLLEWDSVRRWCTDYNLNEFGLSRGELLRLYFISAASIFEPERSNERLAWAKTSAMVTAISGYFGRQSEASYEQRRLFAEDFLMFYSSYGFSSIESYGDRRGQGLMGPLLSTLHQLSFDAMVTRGVDIRHHLRHAWGKWMLAWAEDGDRYKCEAELVARTIQACSTKDCCLEAAEEDHFGYHLLLETTNSICHQLGLYTTLQACTQNNPQEAKEQDKEGGGKGKQILLCEVNSNMQKLMKLVLSSYSEIDHNIRQSFLVVARSYYYSAYCSPKTFNAHLAKVLFERVD